MTQPPSPATVEAAREWLERAERDVQAARNELAAESRLPEMTAYHAQQAVEKALKAFLTFHSVVFQFTHNLVPLLAQCENIESGYRAFQTAAQLLTPYATQFRYPGGPLTPPVEDAEEALRLADEVVQFTRKQLQQP